MLEVVHQRLASLQGVQYKKSFTVCCLIALPRDTVSAVFHYQFSRQVFTNRRFRQAITTRLDNGYVFDELYISVDWSLFYYTRSVSRLSDNTKWLSTCTPLIPIEFSHTK